MVRILYVQVETEGMSSKSIKLLGVALSIALANAGSKVNRLPIVDFCAIADIPNSSGVQNLKRFAYSDGRSALGLLSAVTVDFDAGEIVDDVPRNLTSWPLFSYLSLDDQFFCFEVEGRYLREALSSLRRSSPCPVRKLLQKGERFW